jgi:phage terminase large subunit
MITVPLTDIIAPSFYLVHHDIKNKRHTHYWLKGGRGSTKSTFAAAEIILGMLRDPEANAYIFRKIAADLRESVYGQVVWCINKMQVSDYFKACTSPMYIEYLPTGQKIIFKGLDKASKRKSTKLGKGYVKYVWYEELDEFAGMEEIRNVNQSLLRGSDSIVFYSYNPPKTSRAWVNAEARTRNSDRLVHHSSYLDDVDPAWLGPVFIAEAEHLKKVNETAYRHEYLGEETGTGGEIFTNAVVQDIDSRTFDNIRQGLDWGYAVDPFCFERIYYDKTRRAIYIFREIQGIGMSNRVAAEKIIKAGYNDFEIVADSAEPKSIVEVRGYGLNRIKPARKGPGSVETGVKWLQDLEQIIIDPCCKLAAKEFIGYCLEKDKSGEWISRYPDKDNHGIDSCRYALQADMRPGWGWN